MLGILHFVVIYAGVYPYMYYTHALYMTIRTSHQHELWLKHRYTLRHGMLV